MPKAPSPKPFPFQHPHSPLMHIGRTVLSALVTSVDLGIGHNNVTMLGSPIIRERRNGNDVATVDGGVTVSAGRKKGVLTFTQKKADGTDVVYAAATLAGGAGAFSITPGQTTKFVVNGTLYTKTWNGTAAAISSSGATYASLNGKKLDIIAPGGNFAIPSVVVTFDFTCVDRASTIAFLSTYPGLGPVQFAPLGVNEMSITSLRPGSSSAVILGPAGPDNTALSDLGLTADQSSLGTGDIPYLTPALRAWVAAELNNTIQGVVFIAAANLVATTVAVGSSATLQYDASSTANLGWVDSLVHTGTGGSAVIEWACIASDPVPVS